MPFNARNCRFSYICYSILSGINSQIRSSPKRWSFQSTIFYFWINRGFDLSHHLLMKITLAKFMQIYFKGWLPIFIDKTTVIYWTSILSVAKFDHASNSSMYLVISNLVSTVSIKIQNHDIHWFKYWSLSFFPVIKIKENKTNQSKQKKKIV